MKIGISINEVLRDFIGQFIYTYKKYIGETDIKQDQITSLNLLEFFNFTNIEELNKFMYLEAPLEIFGHADQLSDGLMNHFNTFLMDIKDDELHEIELVSKEASKSIPSTFFFLSKTGCRIENIRFVQDSTKEWDGVDLLITANPDALRNKPNGKISVKINTSYNTDIKADLELDSIMDFMRDEALRNKVLNTKIITFEEN